MPADATDAATTGDGSCASAGAPAGSRAAANLPARAAALALTALQAALEGEVLRAERCARRARLLLGQGQGLGEEQVWLRAEIETLLGLTLLSRGRLVGAALALEEALAQAEAAWAAGQGGAAPVARAAALAVLLRCYIYLWQGEREAALRLAEAWSGRLLGSAEGSSDAEAMGVGRLMRAVALLDAGEAAAALAEAEEAARLLREARHWVLLPRALDQQALAALAAGRREGVLTLLEESRALQEAACRTWLTYTLLNGARACLEMGREDLAGPWLDGALARLGGGREPHLLPAALFLAAERGRRMGKPEEAQAHVRSGLAALRRQGAADCVCSYFAPALAVLTGLTWAGEGVPGGQLLGAVAVLELAAAGPSAVPGVYPPRPGDGGGAASPARPVAAQGEGAGGEAGGAAVRGTVPAPAAPVPWDTGPRAGGFDVPLRLFLLGGFGLEAGGSVVASPRWRSRNARRVLAFLALVGQRGASREQVCDALWPESDPDSAERLFFLALRVCREALEEFGLPGEGLLSCRDGRYTLGGGRTLWVDALAFDHLARLALMQPGEQGVAAAREALALCRGPFLAGINSCPWVDSWRARLGILRRELLLRRARLLAELGRPAEARQACLDCLREHPHWNEPLALMSLLDGAGGT